MLLEVLGEEYPVGARPFGEEEVGGVALPVARGGWRAAMDTRLVDTQRWARPMPRRQVDLLPELEWRVEELAGDGQVDECRVSEPVLLQARAHVLLR